MNYERDTIFSREIHADKEKCGIFRLTARLVVKFRSSFINLVKRLFGLSYRGRLSILMAYSSFSWILSGAGSSSLITE